MSALYSFHDVFKSYDEGGKTLEILKGVNMDIAEGEQLAIVGASGSGKSTLLHLMGALDSPSAGSVLFQGRDMTDLSPDEQARFRNKTCGYVFQFHHLLAEFSAVENVAMPGIIAGVAKGEIFEKAAHMLERVGLKDKAHAQVTNLSGGERQPLARTQPRAWHDHGCGHPQQGACPQHGQMP